MADPVVKTHWHLAEEYCSARGTKWVDITKYGVQVGTVSQAFPEYANDNRPGLIYVHHDVRKQVLKDATTMRIFDRPAAQPWQFEVVKKSGSKMLAKKGSPTRLYIPKTIDWNSIPRGSEVQIHESAYKAIVACERGYFAVGQNGIWGSDDSRQDLLTLPWMERELVPVVVFDSNTNSGATEYRERYELAITRLAGFFDIELFIHLYRRRIPDDPEKREKGWGYDDWCAAGGGKFEGELEEVDAEGSSAAVAHLNARLVYIMASASVKDRRTGHVWSVNKAKDNFRNVMYQDHEGHRHHAFEAWMSSRKRATVTRLDYRPGDAQEDPDGEWYNTWTGWGVVPAEGDTSWWDELLSAMDYGEELELWLAWKFQNPMKKPSSKAMYIIGPQGVGKSAACEVVKDLVGVANFNSVTEKMLDGSFTDYVESFVNLVDDVTKIPTYLLGKINNLIAGELLTVNKKFQSPYSIRNLISWMFTSNKYNSLPMEDMDRRWHVIKMKAIGIDWTSWHKRRNLSALMFRLMNKDVSGWEPYAPAMLTSGRLEMAAASRTALQEFMHTELPDILEQCGRRCVLVAEIVFLYNTSIGDQRDTPGLGKRVADYLPELDYVSWGDGTKVKIGGSSVRVWTRDAAVLSWQKTQLADHVRDIPILRVPKGQE